MYHNRVANSCFFPVSVFFFFSNWEVQCAVISVDMNLFIITLSITKVMQFETEVGLTLFGPGFFYSLKVQEGVFRGPPLKSQEPLKVAQRNFAHL